MINANRIVPSANADLLTIYATAFFIAAAAASGTPPEKLSASDPGTFAVGTNSKTYLANEPLKELTFGSTVTAGTVYFIPATDYKGFAKTGAALTVSGTVEADGYTLYAATLSTNTLTLARFCL